MGRDLAAVALAIFSTKDPEHFRTTPGGYFHGMVQNAKAGELHLERTVWALRRVDCPVSVNPMPADAIAAHKTPDLSGLRRNASVRTEPHREFAQGSVPEAAPGRGPSRFHTRWVGGAQRLVQRNAAERVKESHQACRDRAAVDVIRRCEQLGRSAKSADRRVLGQFLVPDPYNEFRGAARRGVDR
jgi:hypothetical protein